jgi:uncharacterized protein (DUF1015 family)
MSLLKPFRALRPDPAVAADVASVPYDVVNAEEARVLAAGNPLSFLHVTRSEIDVAQGVGPYAAAVYEQAHRNFEELKRSAPLVLDDQPALYWYRLRMGRHEQIGVAGTFAIDEDERGLIKKHEKTRPDKEDDRTRHIGELGAQTGLVLLTHRAAAEVDDLARGVVRRRPLYDFTASDGVAHTIWPATAEERDALVRAYAAFDALYIADGHHRAASAARARRSRPNTSDFVVAVAFPDKQMQILPYNRVVKDLGGETAASFLTKLRTVGAVKEGTASPSRQGEVSVLLAGHWHSLQLPAPDPGTPRADQLDVEVLQQRVLAPLLGIADPRTDKRIDFVGGIRGTAELEKLVSSGQAAIAFSMYPVGVADLMAIADAGGIMPPKSTWFEPKLRDGLLIHLI